jgi:hypothetical protein
MLDQKPMAPFVGLPSHAQRGASELSRPGSYSKVTS